MNPFASGRPAAMIGNMTAAVPLLVFAAAVWPNLICFPALAAAVSLTSPAAPAGAPVSVTAQIADAGPVTACVVKFGYPADKLTFLNAKPGAGATGKSIEAAAADGAVTAAVFGGANTLRDGGVAVLSFEVSANATPGEVVTLEALPGSGADAQAVPVEVTVSDGHISVAPPAARHTADTSGNWRIALQELLRVIQFYNSNGYHCAAETNDGYAPGPGELSCGHHNSDFAPADGKIYLGEVLRLIQFFNSLGYHTDAAQSDGFAPGYFQ